MKGQKERFLGTWNLMHFILYRNKEDLFYPYGNNPNGILMIDKSWLSVTVMSPERSFFHDELHPLDAEISTAFSTFFAYAGSWDISEHELLIEIMISLVPNWQGKLHRRFYSFEGAELRISTPIWNTDGQETYIELLWER